LKAQYKVGRVTPCAPPLLQADRRAQECPPYRFYYRPAIAEIWRARIMQNGNG
jgi:hypothetical protein